MSNFSDKKPSTRQLRNHDRLKNNGSVLTPRKAAHLLNLTIQMHPDDFYMNHHMPFVRDNKGNLPYISRREAQSTLVIASRHQSPSKTIMANTTAAYKQHYSPHKGANSSQNKLFSALSSSPSKHVNDP